MSKKQLKEILLLKFILITLIIFGCKTIKTKEIVINNQINTDTIISGKNIKVIGVSYNEKQGAVIRNKYGVFTLEELNEWSSIFVNKKVCVTGNIELNIPKQRHIILNGDTAQIKAQRYSGKNYIISNAKWELYKDTID